MEVAGGSTMKHATVTRDGYKVPLIGVPECSVIEVCDLCGDEFGISQIERIGTQWLCAKCRKTKETK